jgi:hypothetical protein
VTVQVVDEPAVRGLTVHPADKTNQIRVAEVMGKRRTEDEVCRSGSARAKMLAVSKRTAPAAWTLPPTLSTKG